MKNAFLVVAVCVAGSAGALIVAPAATAAPAVVKSLAKADTYGILPCPTMGAEVASRTALGAGSGAWTSLGPPGGDVADVAASPTDADIVLAGIAPGGGFGGTLYRSADAGVTWTSVADLAGISVHDIEFAPDGTVYAGTQDSVWTSSDDGATFTRLDFGLANPNDEVFDVAIDPQNPATLWAGVTDASGAEPVNLLRSDDAGVTWADVTPPHAAPMSGSGIAIDPTDSNTVIAVFRGGFGGGEAWVTEDGGATWTDRSAGLLGEPLNAVVYDGTRILVGGGQNFGQQYLGVYASTDLGATWTEISDATWPLKVVTDIAIDPNDPQTIAAATDGTGINLSHDGGATWQLGVGTTGALAAQSVRYAPADAQTLYVGANSLGVFKSTDAGATFAQSSDGISELSLYSISVNPLDAQEIAVAYQGNNSGGVFSSIDGGVNWSIEAVPPTRYSRVGFSPSGVLYAISSGPSTIAPEGLYRRGDDGVWTGLGPDQGDLFESNLSALHFSRNDPNLILLGGGDFGVAGFGATVWRSDDAGATWTKVYLGPDYGFVDDIEFAEDGTDQTVAAGLDDQSGSNFGGALQSTDGGVTWALSSSGLPTDYFRFPTLCNSVSDARTFYLAGDTSGSAGAVFKSSDGGTTWAATGWSGPAIADIACDISDGDVLYIAQNGAGATVAHSSDAGVTFTPFASGLDNAGFPTQLVTTSSPGLLLSTSKGSFATPVEGGSNGDVIFQNGFD